MGSTEKGNQEYYVIDLLRILKFLWHKVIIILLIGIAVAAIVFCYTMFAVVPQYSASIMLYVNNSSFSIGSTSVSISASELSAAQSLVDTYIVIMNNRTTMEQVAERTQLDHSPEKIMSMIKAVPVDGTEVFRVTVTTDDPYEAAQIANCIAEVLPLRIAEIIEGSSMRIVDDAVVNMQKVSPNITKNTAMGFIIGCLGACALFALVVFFDDTIRNEDNISQTYGLPVLAKIPNMTLNEGGKEYGYYKGYGHSSSKHKKEGK